VLTQKPAIRPVFLCKNVTPAKFNLQYSYFSKCIELSVLLFGVPLQLRYLSKPECCWAFSNSNQSVCINMFFMRIYIVFVVENVAFI